MGCGEENGKYLSAKPKPVKSPAAAHSASQAEISPCSARRRALGPKRWLAKKKKLIVVLLPLPAWPPTFAQCRRGMGWH